MKICDFYSNIWMVGTESQVNMEERLHLTVTVVQAAGGMKDVRNIFLAQNLSATAYPSGVLIHLQPFATVIFIFKCNIIHACCLWWFVIVMAKLNNK